jgi:hypothetical protein
MEIRFNIRPIEEVKLYKKDDIKKYLLKKYHGHFIIGDGTYKEFKTGNYLVYVAEKHRKQIYHKNGHYFYPKAKDKPVMERGVFSKAHWVFRIYRVNGTDYEEIKQHNRTFSIIPRKIKPVKGNGDIIDINYLIGTSKYG